MRPKVKAIISRILYFYERLLNRIYSSIPIPINHWLRIKTLFNFLRMKNILFPPYILIKSGGDKIKNSSLSAMLKNDVLGDWALDAESINYLWNRIIQEHPKYILEFGSGISTMILAKYASTYQTDCKIISIEQSEVIREKVLKRLEYENLSSKVNILVCDLSTEGRLSIDEKTINKILGNEKLDWVLIDGPFGPDGCRVWTLTDIIDFCKLGTTWFMDDSFRDKELEILSNWAVNISIRVDGIIPIGKGLGAGTIKF
jgi:hypothetical protein